MLTIARPLAAAVRSFAVATLALAGLAGLTGCGGTFAPGRTAGFAADAAPQIDDEDIRKAFDARPQLPATIRVAYYTFDPAIAKDLDASLASLPGVSAVYRIPQLLVTGQRRMEEQHYGPGPERDVTMKKLRLLAARAHADALVVIDHGYRTGGANGLAALNILVVPMFFTPFLDNRVEGYAEAYVVDVRNGYLYGQVAEDDKRGERFATIYAPSAADVAAQQWKTLSAGLQRDLAGLVAAERARVTVPVATAKKAQAEPAVQAMSVSHP